MISLKQILSEQTAYTRFLDKQYSTPEGARAYNAAQRAFIKKLLGITDLEYKVRLLQRQNYWRDKYKHG